MPHPYREPGVVVREPGPRWGATFWARLSVRLQRLVDGSCYVHNRRDVRRARRTLVESCFIDAAAAEMVRDVVDWTHACEAWGRECERWAAEYDQAAVEGRPAPSVPPPPQPPLLLRRR